MIEKNPMGNDRRMELRRRTSPNGVCVFCGAETEIEQHHALVRSHCESATAPLCVRCHRSATEGQRRVGVRFEVTDNFLERIMSALRSLGDFFVRLGEQLLEWAEGLAQFLLKLDEYVPGWKKALPEPE